MAKAGSSYQNAIRISGTVARWIGDKGFGFIQGEDGLQYFVHRSAVRSGQDLHVGEMVTFVQSTSEKGPRAEAVEAI